MLEHLHIQNFKCFEDLRIENLARVNLITGKNNTGKTSLLEAVMLWDFPMHPGPVLEKRGVERPIEGMRVNGYILDTYLSLFYKRNPWTKIQINEIIFSISDLDENSYKQFIRGHDPNLIVMPEWKYDPIEKKRMFFQFIPSVMQSEEIVQKNWSTIALTPSEDDLIKSLKVLENRIKKLTMLDRVGPKRMYVQLEGENTPSPLSNMGEGLYRLMSFMLAMHNVPNGLLLIDEFENGLHYSIQPEIWTHLFRLSKELNVQVFATTHSRDCVEAFAHAANLPENEADARLIRLYQKRDGGIGEVDFDAETVKAAVEGDIEMR